jgi:hypothetical protein
MYTHTSSSDCAVAEAMVLLSLPLEPQRASKRPNPVDIHTAAEHAHKKRKGKVTYLEDLVVYSVLFEGEWLQFILGIDLAGMFVGVDGTRGTNLRDKILRRVKNLNHRTPADPPFNIRKIKMRTTHGQLGQAYAVEDLRWLTGPNGCGEGLGMSPILAHIDTKIPNVLHCGIEAGVSSELLVVDRVKYHFPMLEPNGVFKPKSLDQYRIQPITKHTKRKNDVNPPVKANAESIHCLLLYLATTTTTTTNY